MADPAQPGSGTSSGTGSGSSDAEQSFDPAALRAGVKLQSGVTAKISVRGVSGRPLPGGRSGRSVAGVGGDAGSGSGAADGGESGSETVDNSKTGLGSGAADDNGDVHVLAAEVRSIGDTLMPNQPVNVYACDTGEMIGSATTDESGVLRMTVPKESNYRIEIVDVGADAASGSALVDWEDDPFHRLVVKFVDASGAPLAGEKVDLADGDDTASAVTDENGVLDVAASLQAYELTVRGEKFTVHALPSADHDLSPDNASLFTVGAAAEAA